MSEIAQIELWWRDGRWKGTTRTFSGELYLYVGASTINMHIMICIL